MNGQTLEQRLLHGFSATALGPVVTMAVQLGSVPVLLNAWGTQRYGDWLLLSAVPSYLALSDFGFGDASTSDMTVRVAAGDRQGALCTFQSAWLLLTLSSLCIGVMACLALAWAPWQQWLNLSTMSNGEAAAVLAVLVGYVCISQQTRVLESGFRCDGHFATGTFWIHVMRFLEALAATLAATQSNSVLMVAFTYVGMRVLCTYGYWMLLRSKAPWLLLGFRYARREALRKLLSPALAFVALPAGHAIGLQGFTILIGGTIGPAAVVAFSTLRTLTRVNFQLLTVIARTIWPEMSAAFGAGDFPLARMLHRKACQIALALSITGGLALWIAGPFLYGVWMGGSVVFDAACFQVLVIVVAAHSVWNTSAIVPISTNQHQRIAWIYLGAAVLSLSLAGLLIQPFGITGAAFALLVIDASLCWIVLRTALRQVNDTLGEFLCALGQLPYFRRAEQV